MRARDRADGLKAIDTLHATLVRMRDGTGPIIVGPWLTEVGYELLYWIPFVAWAQREYSLDPDRLVVVSRGGVQSWYAHLTSRYVEILSLMTPAAFRAGNQERVRLTGAVKHFTVSRLDKQVLRKVKAGLGPDVEVLHPSLMYRVYMAHRPWTPEARSYAWHQPFRPVTPLEGLPDRYVAVRFYGSAICPETMVSQRAVSDLVRDLLQDGDVVLLNTGVRCDDHEEFACQGVRSSRLHRIADRLTPATNLAVQTRVIAGASKFVGTYGGYAYLPPLLGVDAETVYGDRASLDKLKHHVKTARTLFGSDTRYGWLSIANLHEPQEAYACA